MTGSGRTTIGMAAACSRRQTAKNMTGVEGRRWAAACTRMQTAIIRRRIRTTTSMAACSRGQTAKNMMGVEGRQEAWPRRVRGQRNKYEGEWKDGKKNGRGVYTWANGNKYEGEFKDNDFNGRGVYTFKDGVSWEGQWENHEPVNEGTWKSFIQKSKGPTREERKKPMSPFITEVLSTL